MVSHRVTTDQEIPYIILASSYVLRIPRGGDAKARAQRATLGSRIYKFHKPGAVARNKSTQGGQVE